MEIPIYPSDVFDWDMEKHIATTCLARLIGKAKNLKANKEDVMDVEGIMKIQSVETNDVITLKAATEIAFTKTYFLYTVHDGSQEMKDEKWYVRIDITQSAKATVTVSIEDIIDSKINK